MLNFSTYPSVRICFVFALGIVLQDIVFPEFDPTTLFYSLLPFGVLAAVHIHKQLRTLWISGIMLHLILLIMGMNVTHFCTDTNHPNHFSKHAQIALLSGVIQEEVEKTAKGYKFIISVEQVLDSNQVAQPASGLLQVLALDSLGTSLQYGDRVLLTGNPTRIAAPLNPDAFDYSWYMHTLGVHYQVFAKGKMIAYISSGHGNWFWAQAYAARTRTFKVLAKYFTDNATLGVAEALLVGYKGHLPDELQHAYIETGSMHVLAVSGAHVGIIFVGIIFLLKRLHIRHKYWRTIETLLILACIWGFAFLAGMGPSIARATVMFSCFLFARLFQLQSSSYNTIAASAFGLLLYQPSMLFQVSFQLSFLAVLGMMAFYAPLYKLSPIFPKWIDYFWQTFLLGIAAQLGTLPLSLYYFGQFPTYFWLSGLIVVPLGTLYMYGAAAMFTLEAISPSLGYWAAQLLLLMVKTMNYTILLVQKLPFALIEGFWLRWWDVLLMMGLIFLLALQYQRPKGRNLIFCTALLCLLSASSFVQTWQDSQQKMLIFYHTGSSKALLCDLVSGHKRATLNPDSILPSIEKFSASGFRKRHGLRKWVEEISIAHTVNSNSFWASSPHLLYFGTQPIAFLNKPCTIHNDGPAVPIDILYIDKQCTLAPQVVSEALVPKRILLAQNLSKKSIRKWEDYCQSKNIPLHSLAKSGAYLE